MIVAPHGVAQLDDRGELLVDRALLDQHGADLALGADLRLLLAAEGEVPVRGQLGGVLDGVAGALLGLGVDVGRRGRDHVDRQLDRVALDQPGHRLGGEVAPRIAGIVEELEAAGLAAQHAGGLGDGVAGALSGGADEGTDGEALEAALEGHGTGSWVVAGAGSCAISSSCSAGSAAIAAASNRAGRSAPAAKRDS